MERLFAVRVLVQYYDKPKVDHAAIRRLLSASHVDLLPLLTNDGSIVTLSDHIAKQRISRKPVVEVMGSCGGSLVQVASVFMLAEARAAADTVCTNSNDLENVCKALERLLGCVVTKKSLLPARDIKHTARVRFGTAARRRALLRLTDVQRTQINHVSILKSVNGVLRLCDVATHCLAVVSRQTFSRKSACGSAVELSTRLLTLAASLYEAQRVHSAPDLSFFSSNSLRTALVTGAMHLGSISVEHPEIEPMPWIHIANRILSKKSALASQRPSVLSALFGGMIRAGGKYENSDRETSAAQGALCLLSTLHVLLETEVVEEARDNAHGLTALKTQEASEQKPSDKYVSRDSSSSSAPVSQAARSFLGERVIAAEEDGDEGRIAARTVYQACDEYAQRAGETAGMVDFLLRLFCAAAKHCRQESIDEAVVSISEGTLPCPPDESDASSDGPQPRSEPHSYTIDVFDQRFRDGVGSGAAVGSNSEVSVEQLERIELHREVGSLSLECLSHWLSWSQTHPHCMSIEVIDFGIKICQSASLFVINETSASYDLKSAMIDFGHLIGPMMKNVVADLAEEQRTLTLTTYVTALIENCSRINPILVGVISASNDKVTIHCLLDKLLSRKDKLNSIEHCEGDRWSSLPSEGLLELLFSALSIEFAPLVLTRASRSLEDVSRMEPTIAAFVRCISCLLLLSHASYLMLGISEYHCATRRAFAALYHRDVDCFIDTIIPDYGAESERGKPLQSTSGVNTARAKNILVCLLNAQNRIAEICSRSTSLFQGNLSLSSERKDEAPASGQVNDPKILDRLCYHFFWSYLMIDEVQWGLRGVDHALRDSAGCVNQLPLHIPLSAPFACAGAFRSRVARRKLMNSLDLPDSSLAKLYIAESLALSYIKDPDNIDSGAIEVCLRSIVTNVVNEVSPPCFENISKNFNVLRTALVQQPFETVTSAGGELSPSREWILHEEPGAAAENSCLRLAMMYMRSKESGNVSDLLADSLITATLLVDRLTSEEISRSYEWMLRISEHVLFLPDSLHRLQRAMYCMLKKFFSIIAEASCFDPSSNDLFLALACRVCGLSSLLLRASSSAPSIAALCKFAHDISSNSATDETALHICLDSKFQTDKYPQQLLCFLSRSVPAFALSETLAKVLVPVDESAIAASTQSQSLLALSKACEKSQLWRACFIQSLDNVFTSDEENVVRRIIQGSIMQSATLHESAITVFERVIAVSDCTEGKRILVRAFRAAREELDSGRRMSLEERIRLINFTVRLAICQGHLAREHAAVEEHACDFLGLSLVDMLFSTLRKSTELGNDHVEDDTEEQMIMFLCGLIECFFVGLEDRSEGYFDYIDCSASLDDQVGRAKCSTTQPSKKPFQLQTTSSSSKRSENSVTENESMMTSPLCTYTATGSQFVKQHWYFCYTCDLAGSEGVCSVCARVCHRNCELAYSKYSRFFCDCGAAFSSSRETQSQTVPSSEDGETRNMVQPEPEKSQLEQDDFSNRKPCLCLKSDEDGRATCKNDEQNKRVKACFRSIQKDREKLLGAELRALLNSDLKQLKSERTERRVAYREDMHKALSTHLTSRHVTECMVSAALRLLKRLGNFDGPTTEPVEWIAPRHVGRQIEQRRNIATVTISKTPIIAKISKVLRAACFELNGPPCSSKSLPGSLLSYSAIDRILAIADKQDYVNFIDAGPFFTNCTLAEKTSSTTHGRVWVSHVIRDLQFHPGTSNLVLVVGVENISILCRLAGRDGHSWFTVEMEIGLKEYEGYEGSNALVQARWVDEKSTLLLVLTEHFVKVFDVAVDTFCPCLFSKIPQFASAERFLEKDRSLAPQEQEGNISSRTIVGGTVLEEYSFPGEKPWLYVVLMTSLGELFLCRSRRNDTDPPLFSFCCSVEQFLGTGPASYAFHDTGSTRSKLRMVVTSSNGAMILLSMHLRVRNDSVECGIHSMLICDDALSGCDIRLLRVPGTVNTFLYFQEGDNLKGSGALSIRDTDNLHIQSFSGNSSSSVAGLTVFSQSCDGRDTGLGGGFLLLNDGSLHMIDMQTREHASCIGEVSAPSGAARQRLRRIRTGQKRKDRNGDHTSVPNTVGFFENCRIVTDHISTDLLEPATNNGLSPARMSFPVSDGGSECMLSSIPNQPFRFTASIENNSLVLVGARLLLGATEQSRCRVPAIVKVFGRAVKWAARDGVKRWLDIPFTIAESTESSQKVDFELLPKRLLREEGSHIDGYVAFDRLELYAVSSIEFTERKLLQEKMKQNFIEQGRDINSTSGRTRKSRSYAVLSEELETFTEGSIAQDASFSHDQAALLALMNFINKRQFSDCRQSGELFFHVNNQWSGAFDDREFDEQPFLEHVRRVMSSMCFGNILARNDAKKSLANDDEWNFVARGIEFVMKDDDAFFQGCGVAPDVRRVESLLFGVAGLSRALLKAATEAIPMKQEEWIKVYDSVMPNETCLHHLLRAWISTGQSERLLCRSPSGATVNAIDILMVRRLKESVLENSGGSTSNSNSFDLLHVEILCSLEQDRRLEAGQRTMDVYDSEDPSELIGSPLEAHLMCSFMHSLIKPSEGNESEEPLLAEDNVSSNGSDGVQRWAYRCDSCEEVCNREWWHCDDCDDYDLCTACLRSSNSTITEHHREHHILLRGCADEELEHQVVTTDRGKDQPDAAMLMQRTLKPLMNAFLTHIDGAEGDHLVWRYIDCVEALSQLVGPTSPQSLRKPRLEALFLSSFPDAIKAWSEAIGKKLEPSLGHQGAAESDFTDRCRLLTLALRVILSVPDSSMAAPLHRECLPETLLSLLKKIHSNLRHLVGKSATKRDLRSQNSARCDQLIKEVWSRNISDLSYTILSHRRNTGQSNSFPNLFEMTTMENSSMISVLAVLTDILQVLEYFYKNASNKRIAQQMEALPRNVLCDIINLGDNPRVDNASLLQLAANSAKRLLTTLSFEDSGVVNLVLDRYLYEEQTRRLSSALRAQALDGQNTYQFTVDLADCLTALHKAASAHPETWRAYVTTNESVLCDVFKSIKSTDVQMQTMALQLFAAGLATTPDYSKKVIHAQDFSKGNSRETSTDRKNGMEPPSSVGDFFMSTASESQLPTDLWTAYSEHSQVSYSIFRDGQLELLKFLVMRILLRAQSRHSRVAGAHSVVFVIVKYAKSGDGNLIAAIAEVLSAGLDCMPHAGELADGLMTSLHFFILSCQQKLFGTSSEHFLKQITNKLVSHLKEACKLMIVHPNARLYGRLAAVIDLNGYYLESEPCLTCASAVWEAAERQECRLDTIRAETKYTAASIMHRLVSIYEVQTIGMKIVDPRKVRRVKKVEVYFSTRTVGDAAELKRVDHPWKLLTTLSFGADDTECKTTLLVPISLANMKLAFVEFHDSTNLHAGSSDTQDPSTVQSHGSSSRQGPSARSNEALHCPRCSRSVTDRHGICRICHENAYQCRQCRNINYENLDGFLCNECGYCKHGRFEFTVSARPTFVAESIETEEDRKNASKIVERETNNVHRCMQQLLKLRSSMIRSLISGEPVDEAKDKWKLFSMNKVGVTDLLDLVAPRSDIAVLEAILEGQANGQDIEEATQPTPAGVSVTEEVIGEGSGALDESDRDQANRSGSSIASPASRHPRAELQKSSIPGSTVVSQIASALALTYATECRAVFSSMSRGIRVLTLTREELLRHAKIVGEQRLNYAREGVSTQAREKEKISEVQAATRTENAPDKVRNDSNVCCYGCTQSFISKAVKLLLTVLRNGIPSLFAVHGADLARDMMMTCALCHQQDVRKRIRDLIIYIVSDNKKATEVVCLELSKKIGFCVDSYETIDAQTVARYEMGILEAIAVLDDCCWEARLKLVVGVLLKASQSALTCSSVAESIILPCIKIAVKLLKADSDLTVLEKASSSEKQRCSTEGTKREGVHSLRFRNSETVSSQGELSGSPEIGSHGSHGSFGVSKEADSFNPNERMSEETHVSASVQLVGGDFEGRIGQDGDPKDNAPETVVDSQNLHQKSSLIHHRTSQRGGSSVPGGSGAPSSTGTLPDGHISDVDEDGMSIDGHDFRMSEVTRYLENEHESKQVTADVMRWLEGRQSYPTWTASIAGDVRDAQARWRANEGNGATEDNRLLRDTFFRWYHRTKHPSHGKSVSEGPVASTARKQELFIGKDNWIVRLMLLTPCAGVRKTACTLLDLLTGQEETLQLHILDLLTGNALSLSADVGEKSKEFFDFLEAALSSKGHRMYLIMRGFLLQLAKLIQSRAEKLILFETQAEISLRLMNFSEGYSLKRLVSLLRLLLDAVPSHMALRRKVLERDSRELVFSLQRAYICVRKLISMRTRLTDECSSQLSETLLSPDMLFCGPTMSAVVSACVAELRSAHERNDAQSVALILEELCLMLCPERKEPTCSIILQKTSTQEEFIRGNMSRNPYLSSSFDGPLMRDVKNKTCRDLDLPGLLEDDFAMELLVAGNLVKLDLPIMGVYDHVWHGSAAASMAASVPPAQISRALGLRRGSSGNSFRTSSGGPRSTGLRGHVFSFRRFGSGRDSVEPPSRMDGQLQPPMVVIYRLSGLDGEATEPIIDSLPKKSEEETKGEDLYKNTSILGHVGGFEVLLELLAVVGSWGNDAETAVRAPALRLLRASCEVSSNRALLSTNAVAVGTLLDCAASAFEHAQGSPAAVASAESLLVAAERILSQQRKEMDAKTASSQTARKTVDIFSHDSKEVLSRIGVFLGRLAVATSPSAEKSILQLLPFLVQGIPDAIDLVLRQFRFSEDALDREENEQQKVRQLGSVLLVTPRDRRGNEFAVKAIHAGIGAEAVSYVKKRFPLPRLENKVLWTASLQGQGLPLVLGMLTGLFSFLGPSQNHLPAAMMLRSLLSDETGIVPILCQLEMAVSENSVGSAAEEVLDALSEDTNISLLIKRERKAIKTARREAAEASRAAILREVGFTSDRKSESRNKNLADKEDGADFPQNEDSVLKLLDELPDEEGISCVVCGDGFQCRPEEALCLYVYCRRVSLDLTSNLALSRDRVSDSGWNVRDIGRPEWEVWSSARARNSSGPSKSGTNSCFTTVTHMNAIHFSCHKEAARVDRSARRDEWDGASLRNSQTKCNNLFPVLPPLVFSGKDADQNPAEVKTARTSYVTAVDAYFSRLSSLGRRNLTQTKTITYDLGRSLLRFAEGGAAAFSEYSRGGGPHSNACLVPHLVQLLIHLIATSNSSQEDSFRDNSVLLTMEAALSKYLNDGEPGDITYYLASSVVLQDVPAWSESFIPFLKRGLDSTLPRGILLRLLVFSDAVHRYLKRKIKIEDGHWLRSFRIHLGLDPTFASTFGDALCEKWESYVRSISHKTNFLEGLRKNLQVERESEEVSTAILESVESLIPGDE